MTAKISGWIKQNIKTRQELAMALTAFAPLALVIGRAPADIVISLTALLFLYDSLVRQRWVWLKQSWIMAALILWAYSVIRAAFISDGGAGLLDALAWLRYIAFAASLACWLMEDKRTKVWLARSAGIAVMFLSADGLLQYIAGHDIIGREPCCNGRLTANYTRPILGVTIASLFAGPIFWLLEERKFRSSVLLAYLCFATIFFSGDRMGVILAALIMVVWFYALMRTSPLRLQIIAASCCFALLLFLSAPSHVAERQISSTVTTAQHVTSSAYGLVWKRAFDIGQAYAPFGVGMHQFRVVCPQERFGPATDPVTGFPHCFTHPHNAYMEWFAEGGIIGLAGFCGFVLIVIVALWKRLRARDGLLLWGLLSHSG